MAFACPVCAEPQIDAEHLANHLAFTAIGGDADHEEWLDSTVEGWGQLGEAELAEIVVEHAEETEFPVDVDPADVEAASHDHGHDHGVEVDTGASGPQGAIDEDAQEVLDEARELTRQMEGESDDEGESTEGKSATGTDSANADASDNETQ